MSARMHKCVPRGNIPRDLLGCAHVVLTKMYGLFEGVVRDILTHFVSM